ncbi:MAG: hypothetical protein K1W10_03625 [Lachnospiraceae bacterium]
MDPWYWISEYIKVFCGYLFLMFLWPSVVFCNHLREKTKSYRFSFCVTAPIVVINTIVLILGLFHGLRPWTVRLFMYGIFVLALCKSLISYLDREYRRMMGAEFPDVRALKGKYRVLVLILLFFLVCYRHAKKAVHFLSFDYLRKLKKCNWQKVRIKIKGQIWNLGSGVSRFFWRYGILMLVLIFGMAYFSYGAFQMPSYGYGDLYIHHKWIYGLIEGNIFLEGIYPEAMHCFIYCMHTLLGIRVYSILLFLQGIHVSVFMVATYFLLRKLFRWRYTPLLVLMLFLTWDLSNADLIHSMFRLQITMPQEFGLHTVFLCALYLTDYLESKQIKERRGEPLFLFMLSLAAAVMIHFHVVLMIVIVCGGFAVFAWKQVFARENLIPLAAALSGACLIALTPMLGARMQGIPFNASIDWAVGAMSGKESRDLREQHTDTEDTREVKELEETSEGKRKEISITAAVLRSVGEIFDQGYAVLYGRERGAWMFAITAALSVLLWLSGRVVRLRQFHERYAGYRPVILTSVLYVLVYAAPMVGLPDFIPEGRFFAPGHILLLAVMLMPIDFLFCEALRLCSDAVLRIVSFVSLAGIYGIVMATGSFRGFLFYEMSRYNAAVTVTESIINTFPRYSYTIISPTDELYPVIQYGWHEELLTFVENCSKDEYAIPSEYVFIYVEKKPLLYAQSHFFEGSRWMGEEKYLEPFWNMYAMKYPDSGASQSPEILASQISDQDAARELPAYDSAWSMYLQLENRTILESKAYHWCQQFARQHPSVLNVYYEDEDFVCYYFRQDAGSLPYNLGSGK